MHRKNLKNQMHDKVLGGAGTRFLMLPMSAWRNWTVRQGSLILYGDRQRM